MVDGESFNRVCEARRRKLHFFLAKTGIRIYISAFCIIDFMSDDINRHAVVLYLASLGSPPDPGGESPIVRL